jgi:lysozyme
MDPPIAGIDVSYWQGTIDWPAVKAAPRQPQYSFCKLTEGTDYLDPTGQANRAGMQAVGFALTGCYHFANPALDATAEADAFLTALGALQPGEVPALDIEACQGERSAFCLAWLERVEGATGVPPLLYTGQYFAQTQLLDPALARYKLWVASYPDDPTDISNPPSNCGVWDGFTLWQHTASASYPGIAGHVDENVTWLSLEALVALGKQAAPAEPEQLTPARFRALRQFSLKPQASAGGRDVVVVPLDGEGQDSGERVADAADPSLRWGWLQWRDQYGWAPSNKKYFERLS